MMLCEIFFFHTCWVFEFYGDKEEGELEEGEIDADAEPEGEAESVVAVPVVSDSEKLDDVKRDVSNSEQLGVRGVLEGVTVANVAE